MTSRPDCRPSCPVVKPQSTTSDASRYGTTVVAILHLINCCARLQSIAKEARELVRRKETDEWTILKNERDREHRKRFAIRASEADNVSLSRLVWAGGYRAITRGSVRVKLQSVRQPSSKGFSKTGITGHRAGLGIVAPSTHWAHHSLHTGSRTWEEEC